MSNGLDERRKALEEAFFRKENEKLRADLRRTREREERKESLAKASGLNEDEILESLTDLGIGGDTIAAMSVVPTAPSSAISASGSSVNRARRPE